MSLADLLSKAQAGEKFMCQTPEGKIIYSYELLDKSSYTITEITSPWGYDLPRIYAREIYVIEGEDGILKDDAYRTKEDAELSLRETDLGVRVFKEVL